MLHLTMDCELNYQLGLQVKIWQMIFGLMDFESIIRLCTASLITVLFAFQILEQTIIQARAWLLIVSVESHQTKLQCSNFDKL